MHPARAGMPWECVGEVEDAETHQEGAVECDHGLRYIEGNFICRFSFVGPT